MGRLQMRNQHQKTMKTLCKTAIVVALLGSLAVAARADMVVGSWQNNTGDGWIDNGNGLSITNSANASKYQFVSGVVAGYTKSLEINQAGFNQNLEIDLNTLPGGKAAFAANHTLSFTVSFPASGGVYTAGYSQIYGFTLNCSGLFTNIPWSAWTGNSGNMPSVGYYSSFPGQSITVTWDYSSLLTNPAVATALTNGSYLQLSFTSNNGGGAPTNIYMNNVVLATPPVGNAIVIGSWQTGQAEGWFDTTDGFPITDPTNAAKYSFVANAVPGYAYSLQVTDPGYNTDLQINLNTVGGATQAFLTNSYLTFTFSVPAWTTGGYSQIAGVLLNAQGGTYVTLPWANAQFSGNTGADGPEPNFYFFNGSAFQSQVVTIDYSSYKAAVASGGLGWVELSFTSNNGGGAPAYYFLNNVELSSGPFGTASVPPPPKLGLQKAIPGLRIFAGSTANTFDRAELATVDQSQSWVGGAYPVSYSFKLLDYPTDINQTHIQLIPVNTAGNVMYNNEFIDYQSSNELWLVVGPGVGGVVASVQWKTNLPNANPNQTALTITNSTAVGTWTLTFTGPGAGTLTAPGASPVAFTIGDPHVATDFTNPLVAYFGLQPNSTAGEGEYEDWASITVTGVSGTQESENFSTEPSFNPNGYWANNSAQISSLQPVTTNTPYWVSWTLPAVNYTLGTGTNLLAPGSDNTPSGWMVPEYYNGYNGSPGGNDLPGQTAEGSKIWVLMPSTCLPTLNGLQGGVLAPNAFFRLFNPPLIN